MQLKNFRKQVDDLNEEGGGWIHQFRTCSLDFEDLSVVGMKYASMRLDSHAAVSEYFVFFFLSLRIRNLRGYCLRLYLSCFFFSTVSDYEFYNKKRVQFSRSWRHTAFYPRLRDGYPI